MREQHGKETWRGARRDGDAASARADMAFPRPPIASRSWPTSRSSRCARCASCSPSAGACSARSPAMSMPSTASISRSAPAPRSAWSANRAAARPPSAAALLRLIEPTVGGTVRFAGRRLHQPSTARQLRPLRRHMQMIFQDPYASLNPRMTVGDIIGEPLLVHRSRDRAGRERPGRRAARTRRPGAPTHMTATRTSSPAASASASASPARCAQARAHRLRRAGLRARRLDPGAGLNLLQDLQERIRPHLPVHRARPRGGPPHLRPRRGDVPRQDRRDRRRPSLFDPRHPYTQALLSAVPDRASRGSTASASSSRATAQPARGELGGTLHPPLPAPCRRLHRRGDRPAAGRARAPRALRPSRGAAGAGGQGRAGVGVRPRR